MGISNEKRIIHLSLCLCVATWTSWPSSCVCLWVFICQGLNAIHSSPSLTFSPSSSASHFNRYSQFVCKGGSMLGQGARAPRPLDSLVALPDSKASWLFWRDFWGLQMLQNPNFPGLCPGPHWRSLHRTPEPLADGEGACCRRPFGASFLRVSGPNPLQNWQPY